MALYDEERRSARNYMRDGHTEREYDGNSKGSSWIGAVVFLLLIGFVFFLVLATPSQDPTGGKTVSSSENAPTTGPTPQPK
jgi:hypothetical protein